MLRKFCLFTVIILFFMSCGDDDNGTTTTGDTPEWFYMTRTTDSEECTNHYIERININNGNVEHVIDSARMFSRPGGGKLAFIRTLRRLTQDSGLVDDRYLYICNEDGSNPELLLNESFGQMTCIPHISPDGKNILMSAGSNIMDIDVETGEKREIINAGGFFNLHFVAFRENSSICAFVFNNVVATYDFALNSLEARFQSENDINDVICFDETGDYIFANVKAEDDYLLKIEIATGNADTLDKGKDYKNLCCNNEGIVIFAEMTTLTTNNYIFNLWKMNSDGSSPEKLIPLDGNGYYHAPNKPFTNNNELLAGRVVPNGNGRCDNLVGINISTGHIRQICNGCLND